MRITKYNKKAIITSSNNNDNDTITMNNDNNNDSNDNDDNNNNINIMLPNEILSCPSSISLLTASFLDYIMRERDQLPQDIDYYHKRDRNVINNDNDNDDINDNATGPQRHHQHVKLKKRKLFTTDFQTKIDAIELLCRQHMNTSTTHNDDNNDNNDNTSIEMTNDNNNNSQQVVRIHILMGASVTSAKEAYHLNIHYHDANDTADTDPQVKARLLDRSIRMMLRSMIVYNTNQKLKKTLPLTNTYIAIQFSNDNNDSNDNNNNDNNNNDNNNNDNDDNEILNETFMRKEAFKVKAKNMKTNDDFFLNITPKCDNTSNETAQIDNDDDNNENTNQDFFVTKKGLKGVV